MSSPTSSKENESDELLYTATRYGPQSVASARCLTSCRKITIFFSILSVFKYNPAETNNKFIISQSFLSTDIVVPMSSKGNRRITVYDFGPRTNCQRNGSTQRRMAKLRKMFVP